MIIKKGDYVLVYGEGNEVFGVSAVENGRAFLDNGMTESIEKCLKVPEVHREDVYTTVVRNLPTEIAMRLFEEAK